MLRIRPFKKKELIYITTWFNDDEAFIKWSAGIFSYPPSIEALENYYNDFEEDENGFIMAALDECGNVVGHFIMRKADYQNNSIHLGLIVVDPAFRGKGYGREMISLAIKYATEILKVRKVTLTVFDNNPKAHECYKAVGLKDIDYKEACFEYRDEKWGLYDMAYLAE